MFNITADLLRSMLMLKGNDETSGAWKTFVSEIKKIRDYHVSESIHFVPSIDDMNASSRHDVYRGISICLDVLSNALDDPLSLLQEKQRESDSAAEKAKSNPY